MELIIKVFSIPTQNIEIKKIFYKYQATFVNNKNKILLDTLQNLQFLHS